MRIFIDESGNFGWDPPNISLHAAVIVCNSSIVELFRRLLEWKTSILGHHRVRELKASDLTDSELDDFVGRVVLPTPGFKLTVVGIDTRIASKQMLEEWRDEVSHYCLGASMFSEKRGLRPADRQYKEMSGWLWNRSPENLAHMMSMSEIITRATQNSVIWFHEKEFESEFADFEIAIDRSFVRTPEHETFWREFFRGYFLNKSRHEPFKTPQHWVHDGHVFERVCSNDERTIDLAPIFRDRTYFVDSKSSEGVQIADICSHICLRYHRPNLWFEAYRKLRPLIVDVNKGPITLLVPIKAENASIKMGTAIQQEVAELAKSMPRRVRRR